MSLLLYVAGLGILCTGIYCVRKSEEKQNAVIYLVFTAVLFMMIQAVEAGIINRIPAVGITAAVFGVLHIVEGSVLWCFILVRKSSQKYHFSMADVEALAILAVFVVVVAIRQFGVQLDNFNFESGDADRHYMYARAVSDRGQLNSLFFSSLNSGLIMNALHEFIDRFSLYKVFIVFETWVLFLNGAMFWALTRRYLQNRFSVIIGVVVAVAYMLGYPWNSMVFGTAYLSTSILCVTMIMFLLDMYFNNVFDSNKVIAALLIISCYALLHSYSLFVPPVLGGIILLVIFKYIKLNSIPAKKVYIVGGILLAVCLLAGIGFLYLWLGRGILDEKLGALSWWGPMYGALYADFLFIIPFCIFWFIKSIKLKKINVEGTMLFVLLPYTFVLFLGNCFGKVSYYYYYKTYYILWVAVFMVMLRTIISLKSEKGLLKDFMFSYIFTWGLLFLVFISSAEKKLSQGFNLDLIEPSGGKTASDYFSLYNFNIVVCGHEDAVSEAKKDLYIEAAKLSVQMDAFIPYIGESEHAARNALSAWTYFALAGRDYADVLSGKSYKAAVEELKKYPYILSVECEEPMVNVSRFLNTLPIAYENESGKIYKVDNVQTEEKYGIDDIDVDIILRLGLPKLERMGWVEQDEYVNSLQVIRKIDKLGLDQNEFLYPELEMEKTEVKVGHLTDGHYQNRKEIVFAGTTSQELQQMVNDYPGALIDIRSEQIVLNETIVLRNNTAVDGNGVKVTGNDLEFGFIGDDISDIYLSNLCIEGNINYGIYLVDCNEINISECQINGLQQKAVCIIGDTREVSIGGNEICGNNAGGIYVAGNVTEGLIEDNVIADNGGTSKWMSGIVLTSIEPKNKYDIWEDFDEEHNLPQRDSIYDQTNCPHELIIRDNQILDNGALGVYSDGAYNGYIVGNTINQNAGGGMGLDYGTMGFYLEGNYLESNGAFNHAGIVLDNAAYNIVRNNIITDHYVGIDMVQASVRNLIMENVVQGGENEVCHQYGIVVGTGTEGSENIDAVPGYENVICRNSITGNHYSGIFIDEGCYVNDVFDNVIMEAKTFSVEAVSQMFNSIINNTSNVGERNEY